MRLLLANGTKVSIASYNATTATVDGNSVPALSIAVNEPISSAKDKFSNPDALIDFNIYPDDKNVVLLHAIGYEKRVAMSMGDDDNKCTVVLAKTTETDILLKKVLDSLENIEKTVQMHEENITAIKSTINEYGTAQTETNVRLSGMSTAVSNILQALDDVKTGLNHVNNHILENDKLCTQVNESIGNFSEISAQHISQMKSLKSDIDNAVTYSGKAVKAADAAVNSVSSQGTALEGALNSSDEAKKAADSAKSSMVELVETMSKLSNQVKDITSAVSDIKDSAIDSKTFDNLSTALGNMKDMMTETEGNVSKIKRSVISIAGTDIPNLNKSIEITNKATTELGENQKEISKNVEAVARDVVEKSKEAAKSISDVSDRVTALEPISDYTTLSLEDAKTYRVNESAMALGEFLEANPITSTCHGGVAARYSITKDKQDYLQSMIAVTQLAAQSGTPYQPSWNATGEVCSYDWTLEQLCQLAMEIETVVRPLVSYQQTIEKKIKSCTTMDELKAVEINYNNAPSHEITPPTTKPDTDGSDTTDEPKNEVDSSETDSTPETPSSGEDQNKPETTPDTETSTDEKDQSTEDQDTTDKTTSEDDSLEE